MTANKVQLINILCEYIREHIELIPKQSRLVVTGPDPVPFEIYNGTTTQRNDLRTTHEEADIIIVQQMVHLCSQDIQCVHIISDDTDVFVLLVHFYMLRELTCKL